MLGKLPIRFCGRDSKPPLLACANVIGAANLASRNAEKAVADLAVAKAGSAVRARSQSAQQIKYSRDMATENESPPRLPTYPPTPTTLIKESFNAQSHHRCSPAG